MKKVGREGPHMTDKDKAGNPAPMTLHGHPHGDAAGDRHPPSEPKQAERQILLEQIAFPIVGIGASAGGLQAPEAFVSEIATHSGMAFGVVSHSHPDHERTFDIESAPGCGRQWH